MLVTLNETLKLAEGKHMALGGFNITNLESLRSVLSAAEKLQLPVILMFAQIHAHMIPLSLIGPVMVRCAEEAGVPVTVHLDHGADLEYLRQALDLGFTSIMYDGSQLPYEENLENTRKAVELAAQYGASVEAELGTMGKRETGDGSSGGENNKKIYTDPLLAAQFIRESGIDALACSFGTTHGIYLTKGDNDRKGGLAKIRELMRPKPDGLRATCLLRTCRPLFRGRKSCHRHFPQNTPRPSSLLHPTNLSVPRCSIALRHKADRPSRTFSSAVSGRMRKRTGIQPPAGGYSF